MESDLYSIYALITLDADISLLAALTDLISDTSPSCLKILYVGTFCEVFNFF